MAGASLRSASGDGSGDTGVDRLAVSGFGVCLCR